MDSSWIAPDVRRDSRVDRGNVRGKGEVEPTGALCAEFPPPSPTYPMDGEPWTVVGSKRARKRARKKKKGKKDVPDGKTGKSADSGVMPPPSTGAGGTRRVAAGGVAKITRASYAAIAGGVFGSGKGAEISRPITQGSKVIPRCLAARESRFVLPRLRRFY